MRTGPALWNIHANDKRAIQAKGTSVENKFMNAYFSPQNVFEIFTSVTNIMAKTSLTLPPGTGKERGRADCLDLSFDQSNNFHSFCSLIVNY